MQIMRYHQVGVLANSSMITVMPRHSVPLFANMRHASHQQKQL